MAPTSGATPRNAPPAVATIFPPRWKPRNNGRQCPSIAAAAREHARERSRRRRVARNAGTKPFAMSIAITGTPSQRP